MKRLVLILGLLLSLAAGAAIETYSFDTPGQEAAYKRLVAELRCLVCQNQNIADSNAELAQDLRRKTYELIKAGKSEEEIITYMVQRYGDFVLYEPPVRSHTLLLWGGPFLILGLGIFVLARVVGRRSKPDPDAALDEEQRKRAEQLLKGDDDD